MTQKKKKNENLKEIKQVKLKAHCLRLEKNKQKPTRYFHVEKIVTSTSYCVDQPPSLVSC